MNLLFWKRKQKPAPKKKSTRKRGKKEYLHPLIAKALEFMAGKEIGQFLAFEIPGSDNLGFFQIEKDESNPGGVYFKIDVMPKNSDKATGYYFHKAESLEALRTYFLDPLTVEPVEEAVRELNEDVNNRDD